ncbi:hypothetical protein GJ496_005099 [Pomphorhynchus laevis]|nr:hypothetical protein GJ496_005099 [Pomphorhynchus laevis]
MDFDGILILYAELIKMIIAYSLTVSVNPECSSSDFFCDSLTCITREKVCDGKIDCVFGLDETNAACEAQLKGENIPLNKSYEIICTDDDFLCDDYICIAASQVCDGVVDCPNGIDEDYITCKRQLLVPPALKLSESSIKTVSLACNRFMIIDGTRKIKATCPMFMRWKVNTTKCIPTKRSICEEAFQIQEDPRKQACPFNAGSINYPDLNLVYQYEYQNRFRKYGGDPPHGSMVLIRPNNSRNYLYRNDRYSCVASHKCVYSKKSGRLLHSITILCPRNTVFNADWIWCSNKEAIRHGFDANTADNVKNLDELISCDFSYFTEEQNPFIRWSIRLYTVEIGPQILIKHEHESIVHPKPLPMVIIPPSHYCIIMNPVVRNPQTEEVACDKFGQAILRNGDTEYRFAQEPFPLYPGETLHKAPTKMKVLLAKQALRLWANVNFTDDDGINRMAGSEWYFEGPGIYKPRKEVEVCDRVKSVNVKKNCAVLIKAIRDCVDYNKISRVAGELWLLHHYGDYLPSVDEIVVETVEAIVLNDNKALHLRSTVSHEDKFGIIRKAGEEWMVTNKLVDSYIPDVNEILIHEAEAVILNSKNYCIILNPVDSAGKIQIGIKKIVRGPCSFFLHPGEKLDGGIKDVHQLTENDGLILRCVDTMEGRNIGDMWLLRGPCEFVPTETIEIVHVRKAIALAENEGIYVKNINNGQVRSVIGGNYMLTEDEELWDKLLPDEVTNLLGTDALAERSTRESGKKSKHREQYEVVNYRIPHNAACQIYDYRLKKSRVVFGPELALLKPDEQFTLLSLSAGVPKLANSRKALCLLLGPDYFEDVFTIETADHARLSLRVSLNWLFSIDKQPEEEKARIFALPDFVGDVCKVVASRIRGAVSSVPFDHFHKHSADIIHLAVFGKNENGVVNNSFTFPQNFLTITSLDIISLEPVDQKTRDALQRTVQLAIEITTNAQEASAKHEAIRLQQEAEARQLRQRLIDSLAAGKEKKLLISQEAENAELETCGQAVADAKSQALAGKIEKESALEQVKLEMEALKVKALNEIEHMRTIKQLEADHIKLMNDLMIEKNQKQSEIEINKFKEQVLAIGKETLVAVANAGPELKVKLLQALGLQSALITDGTNPINLFNTASGLINGIVKDTKLTKIKQSQADH